MTNKEIAEQFKLLGNLLELYGDNKFKVRSYINAYTIIKKVGSPIEDMSEEEIASIDGLGKAISSKAVELTSTGQMNALQELVDKTPPGIIKMLSVRGFGPKKVNTIWQELQVETIGELMQAIDENRLVKLKGFGEKTQKDLKEKLSYFQAAEGLIKYEQADDALTELENWIADFSIPARIVGEAARQDIIIPGIELLVEESHYNNVVDQLHSLHVSSESENIFIDGIEINVESSDNLLWDSFQQMYHPDFLNLFPEDFVPSDAESFPDICEQAGVDFVPPAQSELYDAENRADIGYLITVDDILGIIHCHSTYSDGLHTLKEMGDYAMEKEFEYLLITDHSKSAFYANGLQVDRIYQQWEEVDKLNAHYEKKGHSFRLFKGIESDILNDGSLDYDKEVLAGFDCVIASIHSNLKMDQEKATDRLIKAVENPYTRMLGHMTGRLLLSRQGYPIDTKKVIDACAANQVEIEINANPNRLDIDYRHLDYCFSKGVKVSINPDAHSKEGMHLIKYGVLVGRKGWLTKENNISSYSRAQFANYCEEK